jgi:hypothetical protein
MCESASYVGRKARIFGEAGERGRSGQEQKLGWGWSGLHRRMERPVPRLKPIGQAACWAKVEWRTRSSGEAANRHVMFKGGFPRAFVLESDRFALQRGWRGRDSNACVIVQEARTVVRAFPGTGIVSCRRGLASASKRG